MAKGVKKLSIITAALIVYTFFLLLIGLQIPAVKGDGLISDEQFNAVFGQSMWIIIGSISAFLVSQLIDVTLFHYLKNRTGKKMLWLRSTGSTVISQLFDSFIVLGIAFWLPGKIDSKTFITSAFTGYSVKLLISIGLTPLIYLGHYLIDNYLRTEKNGD